MSGGAIPRLPKKQPTFKYVGVQKVTPEGYMPTKPHAESASYDVTLVGRKDGRAEDISFQLNEYTLGITIQPPEGCYVEIHAKDLLYRQGYFILGGCVIIDKTTSGEIVVPLYKFENKPDLILPCQGLQMVVKKVIKTHIQSSGKALPPPAVVSHSGRTMASSSFHAQPSHSSSSSYYTPEVQHPATSRQPPSQQSTGFLW